MPRTKTLVVTAAVWLLLLLSLGTAEAADGDKTVDLALPPPETVASPSDGLKVTGGGQVPVPGGFANFGFNVQETVASPPSDFAVKGELEYVDRGNDTKIHSVDTMTLVVVGNTATFSGTCRRDGQTPCTFQVVTQDNGEPGQLETFLISIDGEPPRGGFLLSGEIQIHRSPDS
ncbi:MAG TPA: post-COAP-1 domain-containing protein [Chloroflexota bacterium]|jgi:hypothetical protein|nr:post-COAP-1 domain-containing protein [Chloroflexota bacterium]